MEKNDEWWLCLSASDFKILMHKFICNRNSLPSVFMHCYHKYCSTANSHPSHSSKWIHLHRCEQFGNTSTEFDTCYFCQLYFWFLFHKFYFAYTCIKVFHCDLFVKRTSSCDKQQELFLCFAFLPYILLGDIPQILCYYHPSLIIDPVILAISDIDGLFCSWTCSCDYRMLSIEMDFTVPMAKTEYIEEMCVLYL